MRSAAQRSALEGRFRLSIFLGQRLAAPRPGFAPVGPGYATGTPQARKKRVALQNLSKLEGSKPLLFT